MSALSKNPAKFHVLLILGVSLLLSSQVCAQPPSLILASGSTAKGGSVSLNLSFNAASQSTASLQWTLNYPTAGVTSLTAATGTALTAAGKNLNCNSGVGTLICLASGANATAIGSGVVAVVTATLSSSTSITSDPFSMSNVFGTLANGTDADITGSGGTVTVATTAAVSGLQCSPTSLTSGASSSCTVSLSQAAPTGGAVITISDNNSSVTVPASATVAAGSTSATFQATAKTISSSGSAAITASYNGSSVTATVSLTAPSVSVTAVSCNPTILGSNASSTCTATLNQSAPTGGAAVALSDTNATLKVPASVTVSAGATSATFSVTTATVSSNASSTVTATYNNSSATATVSLVASSVSVSAVSCNPTSLGSNASGICTVTLTQPAPAGGASVTLSNSNAALTVAPSITVAAAATSVNLMVTTAALSSNSSATITATYNSSSANTTVSLVAPLVTVSAVSCNPASLGSNASSTCTVTLNQSAPTGGAVIALSNTNSALKVLASVTVGAGATSATFSATTGTVSGSASSTVTATYNNSSVNTSVSLLAAAVTVSSVSCNPASIGPNSSTTCTVTLTQSAPSGGANAALSNSDTTLSVPSSVTVSSTAKSATFMASSQNFRRSQSSTITASYDSSSAQTTVSLVGHYSGEAATAKVLGGNAPPANSRVQAGSALGTGSTASVQAATPNALSSLSCSPKMVSAGSQATCELRVTADPAPGQVQITTSNQNVKAPSAVAPRANQTRLTFQLSAAAIAGQQAVAVIASQGGETVQDTIQVEAGWQPVLTVPGSQSAKPGEALGFEVTAADPAEQAINLTASNLPAGAAFDRAAGRFEWTPSASQNGTYDVQFTATNQTGKSSAAQVRIDVTSGEPAVASAQGACSPGATAWVTGSWLSAPEARLSDPSGNSTELGGTKVTVNGQYVAVLSVSSTEVQFLCPDLTTETTLRVAVETDAGISPSISMPMANDSPRIFALGDSKQGVVSFSNTSELAMARNSEIPAHPAQPGDQIVLWGTGFGPAGQVDTGQLAVKVGSVDVNADAVQAVPGHAGVYAVQVRVPVSTTFGDNVPVQVEVTGGDGKTASSNTVTIAIEPALR